MKTFWFLPPGCTLWQRNKEVGDLHLNYEHGFDINEMTVHYERGKCLAERISRARAHKKGNPQIAFRKVKEKTRYVDDLRFFSFTPIHNTSATQISDGKKFEPNSGYSARNA